MGPFRGSKFTYSSHMHRYLMESAFLWLKSKKTFSELVEFCGSDLNRTLDAIELREHRIHEEQPVSYDSATTTMGACEGRVQSVALPLDLT